MDPVIEFFRTGSDKPEIFACGKCGKHWAAGEHIYLAKGGRAIAEGCCKPGICGRCGKDDLPEFRLKCFPCADLERFEKAEKVQAKDYTGPVEHNGYFFGDISEFLDNCACNDEQPEYVYACEVRKGAAFEPERVVEQLTEDTYEDFEVEAEDELFAFFEQWNAKQEQVWWETTSTVVLLGWPEL